MKPIHSTLAIVVALCSVVAVQAAETTVNPAELHATIVACERSSWEAFQARDHIRYEKLCCEQFYEISGEGSVITLREVLADMPNYVTRQFTMSDVVVTPVADNVCLIRYKIVVDYTYKGKDLPTQEWLAASVWIKRGDRWLAATYQESPLPRNP